RLVRRTKKGPGLAPGPFAMRRPLRYAVVQRAAGGELLPDHVPMKPAVAGGVPFQGALVMVTRLPAWVYEPPQSWLTDWVPGKVSVTVQERPTPCTDISPCNPPCHWPTCRYETVQSGAGVAGG